VNDTCATCALRTGCQYLAPGYAVSADRDRLAAEVERLRGELRMTIEMQNHNADSASRLQKMLTFAEKEREQLREELRLNTAMLARQTDMAREAENRLAAAEALGRELAVMANIPGTSCVGECEKCQWNDASGDCGERRDKLLTRARAAGWLEEGE